MLLKPDPFDLKYLCYIVVSVAHAPVTVTGVHSFTADLSLCQEVVILVRPKQAHVVS